jgi:hypothetical protein
MGFEVKVDATRVRVRLDAMPDKVRTALRSIVQALDSELLSRVQSNTPVKTGKLRSAFRGHVRAGKTKVSGSVDVDKSINGERGIAAIIESGANVPAHEILPKIAKALAFMGSAGQMFAARVQHPADRVPAFHMLSDALADMQGEIVSEIEETVRISAAGE